MDYERFEYLLTPVPLTSNSWTPQWLAVREIRFTATGVRVTRDEGTMHDQHELDPREFTKVRPVHVELPTSTPRCYQCGQPSVGMYRDIGMSHDMTIPLCAEHASPKVLIGWRWDMNDKPVAPSPS